MNPRSLTGPFTEDDFEDFGHAVEFAYGKRHTLSVIRRMLPILLSEASEELWCAGWYAGCEFYIWAACLRDEAFERIGAIDRADLQMLKTIATEAGGWAAWDAVAERAVFVPLTEWQARFREWSARVEGCVLCNRREP